MSKVVLAVVHKTCTRIHEEIQQEEKAAYIGIENPINVEQEGYDEYVNKHGHHFNRKLANWAINRMENSDGTNSHWNVDQIKSMWDSEGYKLPKSNTWGDATYACNMAHSDYFPNPLKSESEVLLQGYMDVMDKDGYPGKIFNRWLSDIIGKGIMVPWSELL